MKSESALHTQAAEGAVPVPHEPASAVHAGEETIHLAPSSVWPITMAGGITLVGLGFVTDTFVSLFGILLSTVAIYYWVQELRHESH